MIVELNMLLYKDKYNHYDALAMMVFVATFLSCVAIKKTIFNVGSNTSGLSRYDYIKISS